MFESTYYYLSNWLGRKGVRWHRHLTKLTYSHIHSQDRCTQLPAFSHSYFVPQSSKRTQWTDHGGFWHTPRSKVEWKKCCLCVLQIHNGIVTAELFLLRSSFFFLHEYLTATATKTSSVKQADSPSVSCLLLCSSRCNIKYACQEDVKVLMGLGSILVLYDHHHSVNQCGGYKRTSQVIWRYSRIGQLDYDPTCVKDTCSP